jgi:hypothetical protein
MLSKMPEGLEGSIKSPEPPLALAVPLSRFTPQVVGGSAFFVDSTKTTNRKNKLKQTILIVAASLLAISYSQAQEKSLNVVVMGTTTFAINGSSTPVTFTGSYVYVKAGKEVKEDISGTRNRSEAFWGDFIKSCTVQRTSDTGKIKLMITEGTNMIFKSSWVSTNSPIKYVKK